MGMYTQLHYGAQLKSDVPSEVIEVLAFMIGEREEPKELPDHELFKHSRYKFMLQCDSYYFQYKTTNLLKFDKIAQQYYFNTTCNLKNYENEIELFVNWLEQYVDAQDGCFLGYHRYEESEDPVVIKYGEGKTVEEIIR